MSIQARQAYLEGEILNASPLQLVQMLYRAALDSVASARHHLRSRDIAARSRQISRAGEILNELSISVNRDQGGPIAQNLVELYDYMQRLLMDANFRQADAPLEELERLLSVLLDAWEKAAALQPPLIPDSDPALTLQEASA
ncbi:MAG: flagellar export chaperone FliS [Acidimicrobiia bacterium]|nr:flagellar export chaperone FliS [Acidimicrobiia bacterium]